MSDEEDIACLLVKKPRLTTILDECLICQKEKKDKQYKGTQIGLDKIIEAANVRKDDVYERLIPDLDMILATSVFWHRSCYSSYTSKRNLSYIIEKPMVLSNTTCTSDAVDTSLQSADDCFQRTSRSEVSKINWALCMFCQKKTYKKCTDLHSILTFEASDKIKKAAGFRQDMKMIVTLTDLDLIAAEAKYHKSCHAVYCGTRNLKQFQTDSGQHNSYEEAFHSLTKEIEPCLKKGKAYNMKTLLQKYRDFLVEKGINDPTSYRSDKLKRKLLLYFNDSVTFQKQAHEWMPELVYSSDISLESVINSAISYSNETGTTSEVDCTGNCIYNAAKSIKSDIKATTGLGIYPVNIGDINNNFARSMIPDSLIQFLTYLLSQDGQSENASLSTRSYRQMIMISQDIIHVSTNGKVKTPKHIGLGMAVRHLTGSKQMLTILNHMGHCSGYSDIERVDTALAHETVAKAELLNNIILPSNIHPGVFVQAAADNNDINEETIDGKHTTHGTTMVLYQKQQYGPLPLPKSYFDHSEKKKSLTKGSTNQEILEFGRGRKATPAFNDTDVDWFSLPSKMDPTIDLSWLLMRMNPETMLDPDPTLMPDSQKVPGWSGFNAWVHMDNTVQTTIGYCPMWNASSSEFSTIYTVLKCLQAMMHSIGQTHSVITFDLAIYSKAKEIQWKLPQQFANTVIRLGGFHIALNYLASIGKMYSESGLDDLFIESGVYGSTSTTALMKGKSYNRGVRAHKLVLEVMSRLMWKEFAKWIQHDGRTDDINLDEDADLALHTCVTACSDQSHITEDFNILVKNMTSVHQVLQAFIEQGKKKSKLFSFWINYIEMVQTLLDFIRAERTASWQKHLDAVANMIPFFCAMDRTNYSRWLPVYLTDMNKLPTSAPAVHMEFIEGNHPVARSTQPFSQVWTDMALEQSVNLDSKTDGGIIGISKCESALDRWFLTCHERADITRCVKQMAEVDYLSESTHKDARPTRIKRDEADIQKMIKHIEERMINPFVFDGQDNEETPLINIASGIVAPTEVADRLVNAKQLGKQHITTFIEERLQGNEKSFWDPLPQLKIKTFQSMVKKTKYKAKDEKMVTISSDRDLFGRLVVIANKRQIDLGRLFTYELSPVPYALALSDGTLRKSTKSILMTELENLVQPQPEWPIHPDAVQPSTCFITDMMATLQVIRFTKCVTFGDVAEKVYTKVMLPFQKDNCCRLDLVFDQYLEISIKSGERMKRGTLACTEVKIINGQTPLKHSWAKFVSNPKNKVNLVRFITSEIVRKATLNLKPGQEMIIGGGSGNGQEAIVVRLGNTETYPALKSNHEEADTRMLLHAANAHEDKIIIETPDTDVFVLAIHFYSSLSCFELWIKTGTGDKRRFIPIHELSPEIGPTLCKVLPGFHALTGCDSTSGLSRITKKKAWAQIKKSTNLHAQLAALGTSAVLDEATLSACEQFICSLYNNPKHIEHVNELRYYVYVQYKQRNEGLPPTKDSLRLHAMRANYQALCWKKSLHAIQELPSPEQSGWKLTNEMLVPHLMNQEAAPKGFTELTVCKCTSNCSRASCACKKNELSCTEACTCMASTECQNKPHTEMESEESDSETD